MALGFTCVGIWTFVCVKALQVVMKSDEEDEGGVEKDADGDNEW